MNHFQATANTRLVGLEIAYLIKKLQQEHDLRAEDVHLIGHSLGAHTAGYAAERTPGLGRITGLGKNSLHIVLSVLCTHH